jgi:predicted nuclease of predicted toxin-antitoxin system
VRLFADTNITSQTVRALRAAGHDVVYSAERSADPGDAALLEEARADGRVFITKDRDIGTLVFRDDAIHSGILLIDDLGAPDAEAALLPRLVTAYEAELLSGQFLRVDLDSVRRPKP